MANNTGPGGFDVDGKQYTFDTGLSEAEGGEQGLAQKGVDVSKSYVDDSGKPKDLTTKTKTTLSQYLSKATNGQSEATPVPNRYPIDPSYNEIRTTTKDGLPTIQTPGAPPPANSKAFAPAPEEYTSYTHDYSKITTGLKKGKGSANAKDGNDLLSGLPGDTSFIAEPGKMTGVGSQGVKALKGHPDTASIVKPYVSAVLGNNRFAAAGTNAQKPYVDTINNGAAGFNPVFLKQPRLGVYDKNATGYSAERVAAVGPLLTMRAGKELSAASDGANPNDGGLQAKALLPGVGQIGLTRIEQQVLLASDVLASLTSDELDEVNVISPGALSWGQLNNVNDPFSGTDAVGMLILSTALVAGVELLIDGLSVILGTITPSTKGATKDAQGRYSMGEYMASGKQSKGASGGGIGGALTALTSLNFSALLGIQPTNFPFNRALTTGLNAFFGIPDSKGGGIGLNQLVGAVTSSADSPGFNVVVCRAIIRSSLTIVDKLKKIGGNVMNAITQILSLIDTLKSSKIIAACNIFAHLGDAILSNPEDFIDKDSGATSKMNDEENSHNAVAKNRLKGSLKLAWAANRAPSNLLIPANIFAASLVSKDLGQFNITAGLRKDPYSLNETRVVEPADAGRISSQDAYAMEEKLEASYVPFYFHDVRTNEMVSFHAFLASMTDDYTANYDKVDGLGRVEPVRIYKGTERKISMSFYIVATSMLDFDEMYLKINKLVTLVYPQYTRGVQLSDADSKFKFTQPFSQLVGASPLIRLRLGDLIRSNYSLFALGRLFGMGDPDFTLDGKAFTGGQKINKDVIEQYTKKIQQLFQNPSGDAKFFPTTGWFYPIFSDKGGGVGNDGMTIPTPPNPLGGSNSGPEFAPQFHPSYTHAPGCFMIKVKKLDPDNPNMVIGEVVMNDEPNFLKMYPGVKNYVKRNFDNAERPLYRVIGMTYKFPITCLTPTPQTLDKISPELAGLAGLQPDSEFGKKLAEFLNINNNAIAKSFQDTGGKGLAGFIESMNFDWFDKTTWELEPGKKAPKMCKVTISFAPIHDITPGLDHNGYNRAPIYPVGSMAPGPMPYQKTQK